VVVVVAVSVLVVVVVFVTVVVVVVVCRSQWPHGQRYEPSSHARTPWSCVRIPLEAWMFAFILFVFCVGSGLAAG
jgi:hypothetical protein